jgi:general secretion pathway protein C
MSLRDRTLALALPFALVAATACDTGADNELAAARAELKAATEALRNAEERLTRATEELEAAREEFAANKRELPDPASLRPLPRSADDIDESRTAAEDLSAAAAEAIKCPETGGCTVPRAFVNELMANPAGLARQARIVPAVKDGETVGFKLYGIRHDSMPKLFGLKNGDMITAVNEYALVSMDDALTAYTKLRDASELNLAIERKGAPFALKITITE